MEKLKTPFNQINAIKTIAERLENSAYDSAILETLTDEVAKFKKYLLEEDNQIYTFSVLFVLNYIYGEVKLQDIINYINLEKSQIDLIQKKLDALADKQFVDVRTFKLVEKNKIVETSVYYSVNSGVFEAIMDNVIFLENDINSQMNIYSFTETVDSLNVYFHKGIINYEQLVNTVIEMEKINCFNISIISELMKDLRHLERIILYCLFWTLINWKIGCSYIWNFKSLLKATKNSNFEAELLKNGNSILIQHNYISIYESETFVGDYYLELKNDTLLSFMEDEISSSRKNKATDLSVYAQLKLNDFNTN